MTHRHTLGELVDYAFRNRKGKAFVGWTREDIGNAFIEALGCGTLVYSVDGDGRIDGVVHAHRFDDSKILFVCNILATRRGVMKCLVRRLYDLFPSYGAEADRRGK